MPNLLGLSHKVKRAVLYELQNIGHTIWTVKIDITLLLANERLITLWLEKLPSADEVLYNIDVRTSLDIEVSCIEESANIQTRYKLIGFIFCICGWSLVVQIEVIAWRSLQISLLERLAMPSAIALVYVHVVHVYRYPNIGGSIGYLIVYMIINEEIVTAGISILDIINSSLTNLREIELHIIIFIIWSPRLYLTLIGLLR